MLHSPRGRPRGGLLLAATQGELNLETPELAQRVVSTRDSRVFALSLTFGFGTQQDEKKDDPLRYDVYQE